MSSQVSLSSSLAKQLFSTTWPMLFGVLSLMSFQLVDSAFIGQLGILPLAVQRSHPHLHFLHMLPEVHLRSG